MYSSLSPGPRKKTDFVKQPVKTTNLHKKMSQLYKEIQLIIEESEDSKEEKVENRRKILGTRAR